MHECLIHFHQGLKILYFLANSCPGLFGMWENTLERFCENKYFGKKVLRGNIFLAEEPLAQFLLCRGQGVCRGQGFYSGQGL